MKPKTPSKSEIYEFIADWATDLIFAHKECERQGAVEMLCRQLMRVGYVKKVKIVDTFVYQPTNKSKHFNEFLDAHGDDDLDNWEYICTADKEHESYLVDELLNDKCAHCALGCDDKCKETASPKLCRAGVLKWLYQIHKDKEIDLDDNGSC